MKFEKYQHIERLGTLATDGILDGICYVFPKLDGTNTSVYLNDDGQIEVASRNRVLNIHNDNQGVCNYVLQSSIRERFEKYFKAHPTHRLFGEWLVPHTIRTYIPDAWRKLYIFDVMDGDKYLSPAQYFMELIKYELNYIPTIIVLFDPKTNDVQKYLDQNTFLMQEGHIGEGIVIKRYDFVNRFGETVWAKIVRPHVKAAQKRQNPLNADTIETQIVDAFLTPEFVQKEFDKIAADGWSNKLIGKFHNPKIDFGLLNRLVVEKIKFFKADLF